MPAERRFFTHRQASALLAEITSLFKQTIEARTARQKAESGLAAYKKRLVMAGGAFPNQNRMAAYTDLAKTSYEAMKRDLDRIADLGVEVKDLDLGLIDFPARYQGRAIYLCFRLGESNITHWHEIEEGFDGRKLIDQEFIDQIEEGWSG